MEIELPEGKYVVSVTNHLGLGPTTIARIDKDRWQIELFFKALTQNLRVKTFVGTSANALHIQVWTALIALLPLKFLQLKATMIMSQIRLTGGADRGYRGQISVHSGGCRCFIVLSRRWPFGLC